MANVKVTFTIDIPDDLGTIEQFYEWLEFELGRNGSCSCDNPFMCELKQIRATSVEVED